MTDIVSFQPVLMPAQTLAHLFPMVQAAQVFLPQDLALAEVAVTHIAPLDLAQEGAFAFLSNSRLREQLRGCRASVIALNAADYEWAQTQGLDLSERTCVVCAQPYALFAMVAQTLYLPKPNQSSEIHPTAVIAPSAQLGRNVRIGARAYVAEDVVVKDGVTIDAGACIEVRVRLGDDTHIHANATIYHDCVVGERCIIHAGAVIGADGFGFAPTSKGWEKIPQVGRVIIGNDVEIGANTTIDRGALSDTVIHDDVKIDNLVQIAHNCVIGAHTAIAGCVAMAGSTVIGERCRIGGAAMIGGHLHIADDTLISGGTPVPSDIKQAGQYTGVYPTSTHREWERNATLIGHLADFRRRLRRLEKTANTTTNEEKQ